LGAWWIAKERGRTTLSERGVSHSWYIEEDVCWQEMGKGWKSTDFEENGNSLFVSKLGSKAVHALDKSGGRIGKEKLGKGRGSKGGTKKRDALLGFRGGEIEQGEGMAERSMLGGGEDCRGVVGGGEGQNFCFVGVEMDA
jgi:hypothetical protein